MSRISEAKSFVVSKLPSTVILQIMTDFPFSIAIHIVRTHQKRQQA